MKKLNNKFKKKGFTLVELLAVIVILAVVILIAVTAVIPRMNKAKKGVAEDTVYSVLKTGQLFYQSLSMDKENFDKVEIVFSKRMTIDGKIYPETKVYDSVNPNGIVENIPFQMDGNVPTNGKLIINSDGTMTCENITVNGFSCLLIDNDKALCLGKDDTYNEEVTLKFARTIYNGAFIDHDHIKTVSYGDSINITDFHATGKTFVGWDYNGDGIYDANTDTVNAAVLRALASSDKSIEIDPILETQEGYCNITIINGTGTGVYQLGNSIQLSPDEPPAGKKFSHWLQDGKIKTYYATQSFVVRKDTTYEAVFVDQNETVNPVGITDIIEVRKDTEINKLYILSQSIVPYGLTIDTGGIIATDDTIIGNSGDGFNDTTARFVRGGSFNGTAFTYTWSKKDVYSGDTWYVRAYLKYTDSNNVQHTVYGDLVTVTM